jgi:hypothetical protein
MRVIGALSVAIGVGWLVLTPVAAAAPATPIVKTMRLETAGKDYLPLLLGPPETVTVRISSGATTTFEKRMALYCPRGTEHDVLNTGTANLQYVYVVSKAAQ